MTQTRREEFISKIPPILVGDDTRSWVVDPSSGTCVNVTAYPVKELGDEVFIYWEADCDLCGESVMALTSLRDAQEACVYHKTRHEVLRGDPDADSLAEHSYIYGFAEGDHK